MHTAEPRHTLREVDAVRRTALNRYWRQILAVTLLVAVLARVAAALYIGNTVEDLPGTADQLSYHHLALRILGGHGLTFDSPWWPYTAAGEQTAHWSYLYTGFLTLVYALFGPNPLVARLIQAVLVGVLQPLLAYAIGSRVFGRVVGLVGAVLTALYAYFIYYAANLMTESFYITAILASFYFALKIAEPRSENAVETPATARKGFDGLDKLDQRNVRHGLADTAGPATRYKLALALGLALATAVLLRQLFLLVIPFLFLWLLLQGRKHFLPILISGAVVVAAMLPFTAYNYARFDRFVLLNTNAGFAFFWGNHPIYGTQFQSILPHSMGKYRDLIPEETRHLDEAALDQELLRRGIQFVLDDPGRYVQLSISRIPGYFVFWPSSDSSTISNLARMASFGVLWPFMLYGLLVSLFKGRTALSLRPPSATVLLYGFILLYTAIHVLTWTLIRYRLPVDAFLVLFAGLAFVDLLERVPALRRLVAPAKETHA